MAYYKIINGMLFCFLLACSSCNKKELTDLNINPNSLNAIDPEYQLAKAQLLNETQQNAFLPLMYYVPGFTQHFAAVSGVLDFGDKYLTSRPEDLNAFYSSIYTNAVLNLTDIIQKTKGDPEQVVVCSMARITRVFVMHRITDMYGDIIYFDAGKGFSSLVLLPKFDAQQDIYADMLHELESASSALKNTTGLLKNPVQDLFYSGDIGKWVKFSNALMLRLAMRMSKADAASAKQWVAKAISGGLMTSNEDNMVLLREDGPNIASRNPLSLIFEFIESEGQKLSKTLIDFLKDNNDPRLMIISMGIGPAAGPFDTNPAHQKGMPNGYDENTILEYEGLPANAIIDIHATYSTVNTKLVARNAPSVYLTYGEVELLLAEASQLGFIPDDAAAHYNKGVGAAMHMYAIFDTSLGISDSEVSAFLLAHPYKPATGLRQIGEQYWIANFTNPIEAWSNWRRSGYPALIPVIYPGSVYNGKIPRRFLYPTAEAATNTDNYREVISRQGADNWNTRMWWDK